MSGHSISGGGVDRQQSFAGGRAPSAAVRPKLERKLSFLERGAPWFVILGVSVPLIVVGARVAAQADPIGSELRGYTLTGMSLGALAVVVSLMAIGYSVRKRALQERIGGGGGTMMTWLWVHVVMGLWAVLLVLLHAGLGVISLQLSSGKVLLICFTIIAVSGIAWRIAYRVVPLRYAPRIGNYAEADALKRAETQMTEIDKLRAGKGEAFQRAAAILIDAPATAPQAVAEGIAPEELPVLEELRQLAASRKRALERVRLMKQAIKKLQRWRMLHVPLSLLMVPLLVIHVIGGPEVIARSSEVGAVPVGALAGFESHEDCAACHASIVEQWKHSMHHHAMSSPVMIAQNNQFVRSLPKDTPPEVVRVCINCHGPVGTALAEGPFLPLERELYDQDFLMEGIGCTTCHQHTKGRKAGSAGLDEWQEALTIGRRYFGPFSDPAPNAYHRSERISLYDRPEDLCLGCHTVNYDKNGDGKIEKGIDLVLQTTDEEYEEYRALGGTSSCIDCHMPIMRDVTDAADSALLFVDQDYLAPDRVVHDHSFVGVDMPLGVKVDPSHIKKRQALLSRAGELSIDEGSIKLDGNKLTFNIEIENTGCGHNLPSGFAFARQMWLEVVVLDRDDEEVFSSGVLKKFADDLCDSSTMNEPDNPAREHIRGCDQADPQLVNFQQKLYDKVEILKDDRGKRVRNDDGEYVITPQKGAKEAWVQSLDAGVVPRVRPIDAKPILVIPPNETRTFGYRVDAPRLSGGKIKVRMLFRALPPYFLRGLAQGQQRGDGPDLLDLIEDVDVVEMERTEAKIE